MTDGFFSSVLFLIEEEGGKIRGRKELQNKMYEYKQKRNAPYTFVKYSDGYKSEDLQDAVDILVSAGILKEEFIKTDDGYMCEYSLTEKGKSILEDLKRLSV